MIVALFLERLIPLEMLKNDTRSFTFRKHTCKRLDGLRTSGFACTCQLSRET